MYMVLTYVTRCRKLGMMYSVVPSVKGLSSPSYHETGFGIDSFYRRRRLGVENFKKRKIRGKRVEMRRRTLTFSGPAQDVNERMTL